MEADMTREEAISILQQLWNIDRARSNGLLISVVTEMGFAAALTDQALTRLAERLNAGYDPQADMWRRLYEED